ncbi:hypothetical protein [Pararobbsia alpina]|uniref:Uncharacterized protein n=1 Tax=Pararobbsia alpina TaxID=621374 RepID=A0A6S7BPG0_9BURK|nr:hypothetical protein [Pararobbsia alpina]CAB3806545.1 hypothetical protein LMG28138_05810 [Pararobbsia alpina]
MSNRLVEQIFPVLKTTDDVVKKRHFSDYEGHPGIVLLGDPGAGKTHLFKTAAESCTGGRYMTVRQFLIAPPDWSKETLFVDALDEKRAGRGDDSVVDAVVKKLLENPPAKLRISCRERDWLGDSDREAFSPFFEPRGGVAVLELGYFTPEEQVGLLLSLGIGSPEAFLQEALERDLTDYLTNPQNLSMLAEVAKDGHWPQTRFELFDLSSRRLLAEHNRERARRDEYGVDELQLIVGAICALRLISDIDGVSIDLRGVDDTRPGFELLLGFFERDKIRAALGRRIFLSIAEGSAVDYVHRTTAEFVGARWLAHQISGGLPVERVVALMGIDGQPSTELRGLHSWLPVFLPTFANRFIEADPHGILTYGDAASLDPTARMHLFNALARLSQTDPWFRSGSQSTEKLAVFCTTDLVFKLEAVLLDSNSNSSLKILVLDALEMGPPQTSLAGSLALILRNPDASIGERVRALRVLLRLGSIGESHIVEACRCHLGWTADDILLKAEAYGSLFGKPFIAADVAELLVRFQESTTEVPSSTIVWALPDAIPPSEIPFILDSVPGPLRPEPTSYHSVHTSRNASTVGNALAKFLIKLLDSEEPISPSALWRWMTIIGTQHGGSYLKEQLKLALVSRKTLLLKLIDERLSEFSNSTRIFTFASTIHSTLIGAVENRDVLERVLIRLRSPQPGRPVAGVLYELALWLLRTQVADAPRLLEELYPLGELAELREIRDAALCDVIPDWRRQMAVASESNRQDSEADKKRVLEEFRASEPAIRAGSQLNWLGHLARIYFGDFNDLDRNLSPRERLLGYLGEEYGQSALEGFVALLSTQVMPSVQVIGDAHIGGEIPSWWIAIVAGLDEFYVDDVASALVDRGVLSAGLAIDLIHSTSQYHGNSVNRIRHEWVTNALKSHKAVVRDTYLAVATIEFDARRSFIDGMHELRTAPTLAEFRGNVGLSILRSFPNASGQHLQQALECALADDGSSASLVSLAPGILAGTRGVDEANCDRWLTAAFIAHPSEFFDDFVRRASKSMSVIWLLRDFRRPSKFGATADTDRELELPLSHLEAIVILIAQHFPATPHPSGVFSGNTNAWDASEFLRILVNRISADSSLEASLCLTRLSKDPRLSTYRDFVLHAAASQQVRRRDVAYRQPNWTQSISTLANKSPANAADLHALVIDTLKDIAKQISHANNDIYKRFWNEDSYGRPTDPKPEESCRHVLIDLLRSRLEQADVTIDPEGHMAGGKRADMVVQYGGRFKIPVELKRNYHTEVWDAPQTQLDRLYTSDPQAYGYGIYGVFWFGNSRGRNTPPPPDSRARPETPTAMAAKLWSLIPDARRSHLSVLMLDVCGPSNSGGSGAA